MTKNKNSIKYDEEFIKENFDKYTLVELAKLLSKHINQEVTPKQLSRKTNAMGLTKLKKEKVNLDNFYPIPFFSRYLISKDCVVIHKEKLNTISQIEDRKGYIICKITNDENKKRTMPLHRLMMYAFNPVDNMQELQVNHKNGNKKENTLDNLEWTTCKENINHARKLGLNNSLPSHKRIKKDIIVDVYLSYKQNPNQTYTSLSRQFKISPNSVKRIVTGERYSNITKSL